MVLFLNRIFFCRVAKTGSQALIALLVDLQEKNKFKATIDITMKGKEYVMETKERVATQVNKVNSMARTGLGPSTQQAHSFTFLESVTGVEKQSCVLPRKTWLWKSEKYRVDDHTWPWKGGVFIKHYNFIDFEEHGTTIRPDYFAVVRNPIERVGDFDNLKWITTTHLCQNTP